MEQFRDSVLRLIAEASTNLPRDVREALAAARRRELPQSRTAFALDTIAVNVDRACAQRAPLCQDTGLPYFEVKVPVGTDELALSEEIAEAVAEATRQGLLRPNSVDALTGRNRGDNLGPGTPAVHFEQWLSDEIELRLLLKGGGCDNVSTQFALPAELPDAGPAGRDLPGVRACVLQAVQQAQGHGCAPGILGVAVGGDRAAGYELAKQQLLRPLDDVNPEGSLAALEGELVQDANSLGIGAMGFGGPVTVLGCKIGCANRVPASFFVTVSYNCWALRRQGALLDGRSGALRHWLYGQQQPLPALAAEEGLAFARDVKRLGTPLGESEVRDLKVGDVVLLSGLLRTARDRVHEHLAGHPPPASLQGGVLYHCGPVALKKEAGWSIVAAGPTTSIREEPYEADVIRRFGVRAIIGKGGMGVRTLAALNECGAVYLSAVGGAAQYYAGCVQSVERVHFLEFGVPEAMWELRVKDFPVIVTMDASGASLHRDLERASARKLAHLKDLALAGPRA